MLLTEARCPNVGDACEASTAVDWASSGASRSGKHYALLTRMAYIWYIAVVSTALQVVLVAGSLSPDDYCEAPDADNVRHLTRMQPDSSFSCALIWQYECLYAARLCGSRPTQPVADLGGRHVTASCNTLPVTHGMNSLVQAQYGDSADMSWEVHGCALLSGNPRTHRADHISKLGPKHVSKDGCDCRLAHGQRSVLCLVAQRSA
jgi:hypothetical protein